MEKHLVLVGGGHAHLTTLLNAEEFIRQGHRVTLISLSTYHYYSGMGPGLLSRIYRPDQVRFHIKKMVEDRGASFVQDEVVKIDPESRDLFLKSGDKISFNVVSFNTGSYVPREGISESETNIFPVKPIENLLRAQRAILDLVPDKKLRLVVTGGGAAGAEISGNLWRLVQDSGGSARITLLAGRKFLSDFPEKMRRLTKSSLSRRNIEIIEGDRAKHFEKGRVILESGQEITADFIFLTWGIQPSRLFNNSGLPTGADGGLPVNAYLQNVTYPEIFGGGDCISFQEKSLDKVGVYAVRQNPILYHNLLAALSNKELKSFDPGGDYLLIFNLGDGRGIFWKKKMIWTGRLSFYLKDRIDRRFMKRFQVSGEQDSSGSV
jgi:NADH dehydrogenase FAD-containing subunit